MSEVFEITKMSFKDNSGRLSDINIVEALFKKYEHPHSIPWEIKLKTKNTLVEGAVVDIQFLILDEKKFREITCKVSRSYKKHQDEPNEYIFQ